MAININLSTSQLKELKETLSKFDLEPKKKQRLLWRIAKYGVVVSVKRYVKEQKNIDSSAFSKRKSKQKRKLLSKLPSHIGIKELPESESVRLYFKDRYKSTSTKDIGVGVLAGIHQNGIKIQQNKSQYENVKNKDGKTQLELNDEPVTKRQIKRLRELSYQVPRTGKKASKKWMQANLTRKRAGTIISILRSGVRWFDWGKYPIKNPSWSISIPSRVFFGIRDIDFSKALARELKNIGFGFDVKAQDIKNRSK